MSDFTVSTTPIVWDDDKRKSWDQQAIETRKRIVAKYGIKKKTSRNKN